MKKILLALALALAPSVAFGQCAGVFPANTICGNNTTSPAVPTAVTFSSGVAGPGTTVVGHFATWNNTIGTLLADYDLLGGNSTFTGNNTFSTGTTTFSGTANFTGTYKVGGQTFTWPAAGTTVAGLGTSQTFSGANTFSGNNTFSGTTQTFTHVPVLPNQSANTVWAGPTSGGAATPAFRGLVAADIPSYTAAGTGGAAQTYAAKLAQTVSVLDYGAKCDGVTNDSTAFANATTAAAAASATLILPGGTCVLGSIWNIPNALRVVGQGKYLTTLSFTAGSGNAIFQQSSTIGMQLSNFQLSTAGMNSISVGDSSHTAAYVYLDQLAFGPAAYNVIFTNCSVCRIQNSDFNAGYTGSAIFIQANLNPDNLDSFIGPNNFIIGANTSTVAGITHISGGGWHIVGNKVITNQYGILYEESLAGGTTSAQMINSNSIEGCGAACVAISNQSGVSGSMVHTTISGNQINAGPGLGGTGIDVPINARQWLFNLAITGNVITTCTGPNGININSTGAFAVTGNQIDDCSAAGTNGINIGATATTGLVTGNTISGFTNKTVNASGSVTLTANGP